MPSPELPIPDLPSPDYTRLAEHLPAVYQEDAASFAQVDAFLGLLDELNHAHLERLADLGQVVSPDAALLWPADLPLDAGADAVLAAYRAAYDEVATWSGFTFPASWGTDEAGIAKRRAFLARATRLWRRRGTPRGFLDWFTFAFDIAPADRPYLLEHFKVPGPQLPDPALTATLFVRSTAQFADFRRRHEAIAFVAWHAPAHVHVRLCWTRPDFVPPAPPAPGAPAAEVTTYRADLRALLCSVTSFVDHANGIHIWECIDEGRTVDRLDVGHLPSED